MYDAGHALLVLRRLVQQHLGVFCLEMPAGVVCLAVQC
jgi:hypothetical protein